MERENQILHSLKNHCNKLYKTPSPQHIPAIIPYTTGETMHQAIENSDLLRIKLHKSENIVINLFQC